MIEMRARIIPRAFWSLESGKVDFSGLSVGLGPIDPVLGRDHSLQLVDNKSYGGEGGILLPPITASSCDSYT
jgi:hypothetical protein